MSRQTVNKWLRRFEDEGEAGLLDRSSRPRRSPNRVRESRRDLVLRLRRSRLSGRAICAQLGMHSSTVSRLLRAAGLSRSTLLEVFKGMPDERYDIEQGSQCIAEIKAEPCNAEKHPSAVPSDACVRAYRRGNAQPGGACSATSSCEWPEEGYTQCARGRCLMFIERGEGESCSDDDPTDAKLFSCALGLFCDEHEMCVPPAKLGESCPTGPNYGDTCESGALCDRFDTKTCIEAPTVGTACDKPDDCEGLACVDGKCAKAAFFSRHFCE